MNNSKITIEHIIGKIDNDFNPDNSDWIPRVAAWCIDAMSQLKVLNKVPKIVKYPVRDRIAKNPCCFDNVQKVYDDNGCEVKPARAETDCCDSFSTGGVEQSSATEYCNPNGSNTREVIYNKDVVEDVVFTEHVNTVVERERHNVYSVKKAPPLNRNYILYGDTIEVNFDTKYIKVVSDVVETTYSDYYKCEIPVIPNNGLLAEALAYYCMYKMLCRGYKHPVFNLHASQYGTNPYYTWMQLKDKAKASVINDLQGDDKGEWRNFFINSMMPKRNV
jgi:hypothetical protein